MQLNRIIPRIIFLSRWLQAPLYLGLILALGIYVFEFSKDLFHLIQQTSSLNETKLMMGVLDLIDVVMIANLLIMVIVGGYEVFVSRLHLGAHPDQPEWLDEVDAGTMKVKLSVALISISSIHLLRTFFDVSKVDATVINNTAIIWQVGIHFTLLISAIAIAYTNILNSKSYALKHSGET